MPEIPVRIRRKIMKLKLETAGTTLLVAKEPEALLDPATGAQRTTKEGLPLYGVQLVWMTAGGAEVLHVKVAGKPTVIATGTTVKVVGLTASPWAMGERSGVSFTADRIEPTAPTGSR
jgi:hypothetical protein